MTNELREDIGRIMCSLLKF